MSDTCRNNPHSFWPRYSVTLLLIVTVAACSRKADTEEVDVKHIASTVLLFSASLAKADTSTLKEICAPEFVFLDDGERTFKLARLFNSITDIPSTNIRGRQPAGVEIATRPDGAWSCYNVTGTVQAEGQSTSLDIIESAYLERNGGKWKIVQVCTIQAEMK